MKKTFLLLALTICFIGCNPKINNDFTPIFNGKNLDGWQGDSTYWSVKNGVLIGEVTPKTILKRNSFIIYQKQQPANFELKLDYRISESGNSGVNYRSEFIEKLPFALKGYQCDIDGKNKYTGQNYEEKKRTTLAYRGEKVTISAMPDSINTTNLRQNITKNCWQTREVVKLATSKKEPNSYANEQEWNSIHVIAKNHRLQHFVNGILMSDVTDLDTANRTLRGFIGVQVHVGPPMKVEYKNIKLKLLP